MPKWACAAGSAPAAGIIGEMTSGVTVVELGLVPASYNTTRYAPWQVSHRYASRLRDDLGFAMMASDLPRGLDTILASAVLVFPTRRRRDEGNFRTPLEKALGDCLTAARYLADDTPDQYRFGGLTFQDEPGAASTIITLNWTRV